MCTLVNLKYELLPRCLAVDLRDSEPMQHRWHVLPASLPDQDETPMTKHATHPLADTLLNTHVQWMHERLLGDDLPREITDGLDRLLEITNRIKLKELVRVRDIRKVAKKYACDIQIGGIIPELVGVVARDIYEHKIHADTTLEDLLPDRRFQDILDKLLELKTLRETLARKSVSNPIFASMAAELLTTGIGEYLRKGGELSSRVPGARSAFKLGKRMVERARPDLGEVLEENLRAFVQKQTDASLRASERFLVDALASDEFREVITDMWHAHKHERVSTIREYAGSLDIEEFFVIGYEYWQEVRVHKVFATLIVAGIDAVYRQLGPRTLGAILSDIGITTEMMREDAMTFAPHAIRALEKKKLLEPLIRESLADYYQSPALSQVLEDHLPQAGAKD